MGKTNPSEETVEEEDVESNDSSEEETKGDTEDSESESEDEESSDDESEEEESESKEPVGKFLDVAKLPKELLPLGKKMQASFTKKMQGLKKEFDDRQTELSQRYARSIRAEKALEVLGENESFKMFLADARENKPYGHGSVYNKGTTKDEEESSSKDDGTVTVGGLMKQLAPMIAKEVANATRPILESHSKMTVAELKKKLPNYSRYAVEIEELVQNEGLSIERAYAIASQEDRIKDAVANAVKTGKKDIKRIPRTEGKSSASEGTLKPKPAKSLREALNFAANSIGE